MLCMLFYTQTVFRRPQKSHFIFQSHRTDSKPIQVRLQHDKRPIREHNRFDIEFIIFLKFHLLFHRRVHATRQQLHYVFAEDRGVPEGGGRRSCP